MMNNYLVTTPASPNALARAGFDQLQAVGHGNYTLFREANGPAILQALLDTLGIEPTEDTPKWECLKPRQRAIILHSAAASCVDAMPVMNPELLHDNFVNHHQGLSWLQPSSHWPVTITNELVADNRSDYIAIAFDSSSQPPADYLDHLWNNLRELLEYLQPKRVRIITADSTIRTDNSYHYDTLPLPDHFRLSGRGGTSYMLVFQELQKDPPQALIYVCDLYGDHPRLSQPDWPVFWISPDEHSPIKPNFGTVFVLPLRPTESG